MLDGVLQLVDVFSAEFLCGAFNIDASDVSARGQCILEYHEFAVFHRFIEGFEFKSETGIRLVAAEALHCLLIWISWKRELDVGIHEFLEDFFKKAFLDPDDVIDVHKGHFQVDLGEFRLAVGSQVFVAEALGDLIVRSVPLTIKSCLYICGDCGSA